ncbi:MAG: tol-pal system protein YbgF [Deltaproteobacteria bacterium]|nr:tol-pal system protein YbgF [Deltaproteobacteria bacterium]
MKRSAWMQGLMALLASVLGLSSCVSDTDMAYLNDQLIALNRRVARLEEGLDSKLSAVRTNQREEVDKMLGEMQKIYSRLEDNERVLKRTVERDLGDQDTLKKGVTDLTQKVTDLERMVKAQQDYLGMEPPAPAERKEEGIGPAEPRTPGQPEASTPATTVTPASKEAELYDGSLALYRDGKYEDAILGFKDFLKKYPKSDRADNAQFWVGESYMALKQYEQAILSYQEVIKRYPKGNKVPNALLRQSLAFLELKDKTSSKLLLRKIVKEYPRSNEAKIAAKKLETLK